MSIISLIVYLLGCGIAFAVNRHALSPIKLYLALLLFFSLKLFVDDYPLYVHAIFMGYVAVGVLCLPFERARSQKAIPRRPSLNETQAFAAVRVIWLLTTIPLATQLYLIYLSGGMQRYVYNNSNRVLLYEGLGYILTLRDSIRVLNLMYWCVLLAGRLRKKQLLLYGAHFALCSVIELGTASRGSLLWPMVFMIIVYDLLKRKVPWKSAGITLAIIIPAVSILSVVRNNLAMNSAGDVIIRPAAKTRAFGETAYGQNALLPLTLVIPDDEPNLQYGLTFATVITNFVPRKLWPNKPDSGGVVMTKEYLGDAWGGASYVSTGIIAESVMNFGRAIGIIFGYALLFFSLRACCKEYHRLRFEPLPANMTIRHIGRITFYTLAMTTAAGLPSVEFTNVVWALIANGIFMIATVKSVQVFEKATIRKKTHVLTPALPFRRA